MTNKNVLPSESQTIVIDGDLARVQRTIVERQVHTSELLQEIGNLYPLATGLLPRNCIAYARTSDHSRQPVAIYVIERAARAVNIRLKDGTTHDQQTNENVAEYRLSWPHTYWLAKSVGTAITDLYIVCSKMPIQDLNNAIFVLPMPNIYENGQGGLCLGNLVVPDEMSLPARIECLIESVVSSLWNNDLPPNFDAVGVESLAQWAQRSAEDPDVGLKLTYLSHRHETLEKLMHILLEESP